MRKVYVLGHKKPDTDSVTAAINLAYLKKIQGVNAVPAVLGEISRETKFALDYFKMKEPKYLNDVKLQIKDLNYHKGVFLNHKTSIKKVYDYMQEKEITGVPIVDDNQKFASLVTIKGIAKAMIEGNTRLLNTSYDNILETIDGEEVLRFDDEVTGNLKVASFKSTTFFSNVSLTRDDILIVGDRHSIIEYAVESGVKLIIVIGNGEIKPQHIRIAKENQVNLIRTKLETFDTARLIPLSNYISNLFKEGRFTVFNEKDYYDEFLIKSSKLRHNNYPVIGASNKCVGLLRVTDIDKLDRKKVILVDHNEIEQSVDGLDEAEILEIVDHHKLGSISTNYPVNFRNMTVGSTNTILYFMYKEQNVEIPIAIMGLMLSGILSDTLALTSPTTTSFDKEVVKELSTSLKLDYQKYAKEMFKAGTSLEGRTKEEILTSDMKAFPFEDKKFAVSQVFTLNFDAIYEEKEEYISLIEQMTKEKEYKFTVVAVTDILKNGSYLFFSSEASPILEDAFSISEIEQGVYVDGLVSRKKQIVPKILENIR